MEKLLIKPKILANDHSWISIGYSCGTSFGTCWGAWVDHGFMLLVIQRMGKAIKSQPKIPSCLCGITGRFWKSFGIQELLDQIGAFLGPVLLYLVMLFKTTGTVLKNMLPVFAILAIPWISYHSFTVFTKHKFPNPEHFEPEPKEYIPFKMKKEFIFYIAGISLFAFDLLITLSLLCMYQKHLEVLPVV